MTTIEMRPSTPVPPATMANPCTPPPCSRVNPFLFASCPPAPRARKRIIQTDLDAFAKADIFLPTNAEMDDENEAPVPFILAPLTPLLPKHNLSKTKVVRPAAKRLKRRSVRPLPQLDISRTITEDEADAQADQRVRIRFRKSLNNADLFCKMWSGASPTPGPKVTLKRRNSCNAMCA